MSSKELDIALQEFYKDAKTGYTVEQKCETTIKNIKATWKLFLRLNQIDYCHQVNDAALRRFFEWGHKQRKWKPMTIRSHRKNLSVFILWAMNQSYIRANPLRRIPKPKVVKRLPKYHTEKEIEAMIQSIELNSKTYFEEVRNKAIIGMAALAGLRRGELANVRLHDINMDSRQLFVQGETSKVRSERSLFIVQRLHDYLKAYLAVRDEIAKPDCRYLWVSAVTGKKLSIYGLGYITEKLSKDLGFRVKMHSLRHSFGTYMYAGTHDIKAVQEAMGHTEVSTTIIYVNSLSEDKRNAMEMNPLNRV